MKSLHLPSVEWFKSLRGKLIVSCQALVNEPLFGSGIMARMALAAKNGGAVAIRANTPEDIHAIHSAVNLPIFGLYKENIPGFDVYITPTLRHVLEIYQAGASVICIDATSRQHPSGLSLSDYIQAIKQLTHCPVMADISTYDEGIFAEASGADIISTTLSGYTNYSPSIELPDFDLIRKLSQQLQHPLIAEGRISTPEQAREAIDLGAYAVIVGGAITRPTAITSRFVNALK